jgi:hypothetical protein
VGHIIVEYDVGRQICFALGGWRVDRPRLKDGDRLRAGRGPPAAQAGAAAPHGTAQLQPARHRSPSRAPCCVVASFEPRRHVHGIAVRGFLIWFRAGNRTDSRTLAPQQSDSITSSAHASSVSGTSRGPYAASIRRRVQPLRRRLAQLRGFAILRGEETRCYELRGAHPAAW